jgi:transposase InsO family protein
MLPRAMHGCTKIRIPGQRRTSSIAFAVLLTSLSKTYRQTINGSEFALEFEKATIKLKIQRYSSRVKTPKDNPEIERFNQTLEYEWLYDSNLSLDPEELNPRLTEWLIEYNFNRPHQSPGYLAPIEYIEKELAKIPGQVSPMWSASKVSCTEEPCLV